MILEVFPSGPLETNAILLACSKTRHAALIDAPFESASVLLARIKQLDLTVKKILLTHTHWDHMAEAALLKKQLGAELYVHEEDAENLQQPGKDGLPLFYPITPATPDHYLFDGQELEVGNLRLKVLHTPGHSLGSVCFYLEKEKVLISGDTLFRGTYGKVSFPTSSPEKMWNSLKKLAHLPKETKVYPGHGPETTIGEEASWMAHPQDHF